MKRLVACLLVGITALVGSGTASSGSSETEAYALGAAPYPYPHCYLNGARMRPSYSGACFLPPAGVRAINASVSDAGSPRVGAQILFTVGEDGVDGPVFCGSITNVAVPPGTEGINISTSPVRAAAACGAPSLASSGRIRVDYLD